MLDLLLGAELREPYRFGVVTNLACLMLASVAISPQTEVCFTVLAADFLNILKTGAERKLQIANL